MFSEDGTQNGMDLHGNLVKNGMIVAGPDVTRCCLVKNGQKTKRQKSGDTKLILAFIALWCGLLLYVALTR